MTTIPPVDLTRQHALLNAQLQAAAIEVLHSGRYIGGEKVAEFERQFAAAIGTRICAACNSGTDALLLGLRALEIAPGDEVITTPFTFAASVEPLAFVGARPIFVDIDPATYNLEVTQVEAAISARTRALLPVHLFGQPTDMTQLGDIARRHDLLTIEDCAQATGACWGDRALGSFGEIGCFSFFPTKNLGALGDGGAVTTDDPELAARVRMFANHGQVGRYDYLEIGTNSRLDALQAALLLVKLPHLDAWNLQRCQIATRYLELLASLPGIALPITLPGGTSVWNQFTLRILDDRSDGEPRRDRIREHLRAAGIDTMVYYPYPLHLQPAYAYLGYRAGQFPYAERVAREVLSLPMFPGLTADEQERVALALKDAIAAVA
ncbi:DegT/DnrJ/EryC1/StrS family aminotransferase [Rubidibacter lacunae]|uniref:DegT/DnrJ/EryC1/StrS family aminotransferase n=1 Tax=Rubidibacter lacunae TaxID=582514 RepID=UPI000A037A7F|nr:DegT/DnrJ/EryC1/StrS family aminotransferase [Rubidibacter lacunae]